MSLRTLLAIVLMLLLSVSLTEGKKVSGSFKEKGTSTDDRFQYVNKFCFDTSGKGKMEGKFWSSAPTDDTLVLLYDDEKDKSYYWFDVWDNDDLDCLQKTNRSNPAFASPPCEGHPKNLVVSEVKPGEPVEWQFEDKRRAHYWYFAASQCNDEVFDLHYEIHFINGGSSWDEEFSCEDQGLLTMYIVFFIVWTLGAVAQGYATYGLWRKNSLHLLARLLSGSIAFEVFALLCIMIHYAVYASDGVGAPALAAVGYVLDFLSVMAFMLLLILISKGWAITRYQFTELKGKRLLIGILVTLFLAYLAMFIWQELGLNPSENYWIYETIPGIILLVLRSLTMFYFLWNVWVTYRIEDRPEKRRFYIFIGLVGGLWFASLPIFAGISSALDDWVAVKTVNALNLSSMTIFYGIFAGLMWPSISNKYFEFSPPGAFDATSGHYDEL